MIWLFGTNNLPFDTVILSHILGIEILLAIKRSPNWKNVHRPLPIKYIKETKR